MSVGDAAGYTPSATERTLSLPAAPEEKPPDRMGVHILLEAMLAIGFAVTIFLLARSDGTPLAHAVGRADVVVLALPLLLMAMALAVALRVGVVNLAVAVIGLVAARVFVDCIELGTLLAAVIAVTAAALAGLALATLVVVSRVPGWLGSAILAAGGWAWVTYREPVESLEELDPSRAWIWLVGAAALSILGGVIATLGGVRAALGACRAATADIVPRGTGTVLLTFVALGGSGALAGLAGVWMTWAAVPSVSLPVTIWEPLPLTLFALGAALLGGTSLYGRRGGVLGTLLATLLLATTVSWVVLHGWFPPAWVLFGAICLGIVVNRVVEAWGVPAKPRESQDEMRSPPSQHKYGPGDTDPYRGVGSSVNYGP